KLPLIVGILPSILLAFLLPDKKLLSIPLLYSIDPFEVGIVVGFVYPGPPIPTVTSANSNGFTVSPTTSAIEGPIPLLLAITFKTVSTKSFAQLSVKEL